jgi:hypothetical protein
MAVDKILIQYEADIKKLQKDLRGVERQMGVVEKKADKSAKKVEKSFRGVGDQIRKVGAIVGVGIGVTALLAFGKQLAKTATQMEAFKRRAAVVFGDSLGIVEDFAKQNAISLGLTENAFLGAAAAVGDILVPLGLSRKAAANMSNEAVKLGGALKQFTGDQRSAGEIANVVAKAFTGEVEGLKGLGVVVNQNDKAFRDLVKTKIQDLGMTESQAKAQAIFETVLDRSKDAINAFEQDTGSLMRQQAELNAQWATLTETLAETLTPALLEVTTTLNDSLKALRANVPWWKRLLGAINPVAGVLAEVEGEMNDLKETEEGFNEETEELEKTQQREIITLELLRAKLKDAKKELDKAEIGTRAFSNAQAKVEKISDQITIALGKETEAWKESKKELERVNKILKDEGGLIGSLETLEDQIRGLKTVAVPPIDEDFVDPQKEALLEAIDDIEKYGAAIIDVFGSASNLISTLNQRELDELRAKNDKRLELLKEQDEAEQEALAFKLDNRQITEQEAENMREEQQKQRAEREKQLRQQIEREEKEAARKQAVREKLLAIFDIGINTAKGIVKAVAESPITFGLPFSAFVGAAGALQLAAVLATPLPGFKKGKVDIDGEGTETSDSILARLSKHESVINAKATKKYKKALEAANDYKLDEFINVNYVLPALKKQTQLGLGYEQWDDENIVRSLKKNNRTSRTNTGAIVKAIKEQNDHQFYKNMSW